MQSSIGPLAVACGAILGFFTIPFAGALSDKFGRMKVYRVGAIVQLVLALAAWPLLSLGNAFVTVVVIAICYGIGVNIMLGAQCAALPELFGSRHRYIGVAVAREFSAIIAGGIAPFVGALLLAWFSNSWIPLAIYVIVLTLITLYTTFVTPDTRARDLTLLSDAVKDTEEQVQDRPAPLAASYKSTRERPAGQRLSRHAVLNPPTRLGPTRPSAQPARSPVMRIARIATDHGPVSVVQQADQWAEVIDPFADRLEYAGVLYPVATATLLAPVQPLVVLGMAHNGAPGDRELPRQAFSKSPRTVVGPGDTIVVDDDLGQVNIEGELAVVIRRTSRHLTAEQVPDSILGYTIGNDVTAVDQIALDEKMTQSKHGDGFTPIGPWIETDLDNRRGVDGGPGERRDRCGGKHFAAGLEHHRAIGLPHPVPDARAR